MLPGTTISSSGTSTQSDELPTVVPTTAAASGITQTTLSVPSTHVMTTIPVAPTASPPTFTPTGTPDANVPTAITGFPTATTTVASAIYAGNVAQAKDLNKLYSSLTPQSACSGTQMACIQGKRAQCTDGAFVLTACAANEKCYALPMTNTQGAKIACRDPEEAIKILGPASEGGTSTTSVPSDEVPTTFRTKAKKPVLTHTQFVTFTDVSSTAPGQSTVESDPATLIPTTTELPPGTTTITSSSSSSSPPPPPPPPQSTTNQPSRIVITQTFNEPTQTTIPTTTPGLLELIPVELTTSSSPAPPITTPIPVAAKPATPNDVDPGGVDPPPAPAPAPDAGNPRTSVTSNGTPTVSVCFNTATVTQIEKETVTVTVTATPTLIVPA
ncbi:hypothetical protein EsDP_00003002 [Epichloe bromicola]|uniref:Carbohydrate-binding module family 19 protein n=1 Tax=Epichloe bromicola TaxID=79588 RepID=A0ABQ0CMG1_9HYPO